MRILLFSQMMYGGAWRRNYNVLKTVRKVNERTDYVLLLESSNIKLVPDIKEVMAELKDLYDLRLMKLPSYLKFSPSYYTYMRKLSKMIHDVAREEKVDLIYVPHEVDWWILAAKNASKGTFPWTSLFQSTPLFVCIPKPGLKGPLSTMMETPLLADKSFKVIRGFYKYFRLQRLAAALKETLSLSVSENITKDLKTFYPWLKIRTLTPGVGVDLDYISSIRASSNHLDAIYFTSELIPPKGFLELPMLWKNVVESMPKARLLIAGKAQRQYLQQFLELSEEFNVKKNIILCDLLPYDKLISLVKSSKVMVYPSQFDAFPLVILESLASGTPVIAYDIPAVRLNYITKSVVKCPINNAKCIATNVVKILSDDDLRKSLSQEAVKYAANFTWEKAAEEEVKGYLEALDFWSCK